MPGKVETEKWGDLRRRIDDVMEVFDEIEKRLAKRDRGPNSAAILTAAVMLGKNDQRFNVVVPFGKPDTGWRPLKHSPECSTQKGCAPDCDWLANKPPDRKKPEPPPAPPRKKDGWVSLRRDNKGQNGL